MNTKHLNKDKAQKMSTHKHKSKQIFQEQQKIKNSTFKHFNKKLIPKSISVGPLKSETSTTLSIKEDSMELIVGDDSCIIFLTNDTYVCLKLK